MATTATTEAITAAVRGSPLPRPSIGGHRSFLQGRASIIASPFLSSRLSLLKNNANCGRKPYPVVRAVLKGEEPGWQDDDYIVLGVAHCFEQEEGGKLTDVFLVEPVSASSVECMDNGGATCYLHIAATDLGTALKLDVSLLPSEFAKARFCDDFDFRVKCASRTWKRPHAVKNLKHLNKPGVVRSDFNFSLADKRIINKENVVTDSDNIKQDLSIDVYGRKDEAEAKDESASQVASLYNA